VWLTSHGSNDAAALVRGLLLPALAPSPALKLQVASHAQKYFLREGLPASRREKKRPSIHDIRSASETPCMTPDERLQLRNSLQIINRESMESIDTHALEGGRVGVPSTFQLTSEICQLHSHIFHFNATTLLLFTPCCLLWIVVLQT
jgi:hypothetical protein